MYQGENHPDSDVRRLFQAIEKENIPTVTSGIIDGANNILTIVAQKVLAVVREAFDRTFPELPISQSLQIASDVDDSVPRVFTYDGVEFRVSTTIEYSLPDDRDRMRFDVCIFPADNTSYFDIDGVDKATGVTFKSHPNTRNSMSLTMYAPLDALKVSNNSVVS